MVRTGRVNQRMGSRTKGKRAAAEGERVRDSTKAEGVRSIQNSPSPVQQKQELSWFLI